MRKIEEAITQYVPRRHEKPRKDPWFYVMSRHDEKVLNPMDYTQEIARDVEALLVKVKKDYFKPDQE